MGGHVPHIAVERQRPNDRLADAAPAGPNVRRCACVKTHRAC
jgi:hypothetical protein